MRKMNDLVNQAIQCNQLGSPIIFIDSCTTHGIYLHRNDVKKRKPNRFQAEKQPNKQNESFETVLINYSRLFTNCFVWVPGWIVGLIWDCWRFIKGFFVIMWWMWDSWESDWNPREMDGDSWGFWMTCRQSVEILEEFCRIDYNPREILERLVEILNDSWGDWQEFLELSWHSRGFLPSWCTRMRFLRIIRLFVTILRGFFTAAHATE